MSNTKKLQEAVVEVKTQIEWCTLHVDWNVSKL